MTKTYITLVVAFCGLGCDSNTSQSVKDQAAAEERTPLFFEDSALRGVSFRVNSDLGEGALMPEIMLGGGAAFDFDDDGWLDLYFIQGSNGANELYRNRGDGTFEQLNEIGDAADTGYGFGTATADVDADGDVDLFVSNLGKDVLLRNDGDGHFTDVTDLSGLGDIGWGTSATFFDADLDGDPDLFVTRYIDWSLQRERFCTGTDGKPGYCAPGAYNAPTSDLFYENIGDGKFVDRSKTSGVSDVLGTGLGVAAADFDNDSLPDIFVANDDMPDRLWRNLGNGQFEEVGFSTGCDRDLTGEAKAGMGVSVEDIDNDGDQDLIVCNLAGETDSFYLNENGRFTDVTNRSGIGKACIQFTRFGLGFVDFDNDGTLDYFAANGKVRRDRTPANADPYAEINLVLKGQKEGVGFQRFPNDGLRDLPPRTSRGAIFGDFDNDGGMDIVVLNRDAPIEFLTNTTQTENWLLLDVRHASGGPALGAIVTVEAGSLTLNRTVRSDSSYLTSRDPRVHLGLKDASIAEKIKVRWPDGHTEVLTGVDCNQIVTVKPTMNHTEGAGKSTLPGS